jgi:hypothetical protein
MPGVKVTSNNQETVKLERNGKIINRKFLDYKTNKKIYEFRGFKLYEAKIEPIEKEVKKIKRKTTRKD